MLDSEQLQAVLQSIGLCAKAGKLAYGVPMICELLKKGKRIHLVLSAHDNAQNSAKRLSDRCSFYGVRQEVLKIDGEVLASAVGKGSRLAAVAVTDEQLSHLVLSKLKQSGNTI